jgi:Phosphorylase superfamily
LTTDERDWYESHGMRDFREMSWPFDISEPFITPSHGTEFQRRRHGLTPEEWALPPTLVATFQRDAYRRMLERGGVDARNSADWAIGEVDGVPCALARISIGAPAAALLLEDSVVRGVRNVFVVGSAGSLQRQLPSGTKVIVTGAEREDGTSHHYLPAGEIVSADSELTVALEECSTKRGAGPVRGRSWTIDAPYRETVGTLELALPTLHRPEPPEYDVHGHMVVPFDSSVKP